jgi:ketosteroid isomerase-like protein
MDARRIEEAIRRIIHAYEDAVNAADADALEALFWLDDQRFSEVQTHIPLPFGESTWREISESLRRSSRPGVKREFLGTWVFPLTEDVAYSVSYREETATGDRSRVTFVYLRRGSEWRIVHGHFSDVPR